MRWTLRDKRLWLHAVFAVFALYFVLYHFGPALYHEVFPPRLRRGLDPSQMTSLYPASSNYTTNLVVASVRKDDISWAKRLEKLIPNLRVIRYVSDDPTAQYHPPVPKAREALMYFTYLKDFYDDDNLADINIFVHADETAWHTDSAFRRSLTFALLQLDPTQVIERGYFNLRTEAGDSLIHDCPNGFSTSKVMSEKGEDSLIAPAFRANFPDEDLPEVLGGPCCSQFAVSKATVLSRPREQYERSAQFLIDSPWSDQMVGRPWERMWAYLFQRRAMDCNVEWAMLCRMYGVCFRGWVEHRRYEALWRDKSELEEQVGFWKEIWSPGPTRRVRARLLRIDDELQAMLQAALMFGQDEIHREEAGSAIEMR